MEDQLIERLTAVTERLSEEEQAKITEKWDVLYLKMLSMFVDKVEKEYPNEQ